MRPRGSVTGPIVIIAIGIIFLVHAIQPGMRIVDYIGLYWPYVLIAWGVLAFLEVTVRFVRGAAIPVNGISGGAWFAIVLICLAGVSLFELQKPGHWWSNMDWGHGFNEAFLGEDHAYTVETVQKTTGAAPHIVIESFRGDAKISGGDAKEVSVSGQKSVKSVDLREADRANQQTPVEVLVDGNTVTIRCHQDRSGSRALVTTDLEISVPRGASLEATGTYGDFDVSSLTGNVTVSSANAGVHLDDIGGNVTVDTRHSDIVRCTNVKGTVDLRGHGTDIEVTNANGEVTISGDYSGTVALRELAKPVRVENLHTILSIERVPGEVRLDRGSLTAENVIGPVKLTARSTDVNIDGVQNGLDLTLDRGDIDLRPGHLPLGNMVAHTRSGNIELALPETATFQLTATTDHGDIDNEYGDGLKEQSSGKGARLEGSAGTGPDLNLMTGRGSITVRKASASMPQAAPPAGASPARAVLLLARPVIAATH
ncbi:MAG: DUF4097 family beta strand repeat protein [Acidobacteriaceae bacterium]|nr:DUF4097 family beta strand repeat protein [Acidobacteriaceae bacterium]